MKRVHIILTILLSSTLLSGCRQLLNAQVGSPRTEQTEMTGQAVIVEVTDVDRESSYTDYCKIMLDARESSPGGEYTWDEGILNILSPGTYVLEGNLNGGVYISVYDDEIVHLILKGVEIINDNGPAIYVEKAGKTVITLSEQTENTLSDGAEYAGSQEACIFSNADLTINGTGMLNVYGYYHDAIRTKDCIKLVETNVLVRAKNNGIRGNDGVVIKDSRVQIESEGTGILSKGGKNFVVVESGSCKVTAGDNAISAGSYVSLSGCEAELYSVREAVQCEGLKEIDEEYLQ